MRASFHGTWSLPTVVVVVVGTLFLHTSARAEEISKTVKVGPSEVTLKVLPAESFTGVGAAMARDGGAEPNAIDGREHPNHHLVAFIKRNGKPVEDAAVSIEYRELAAKEGKHKPDEKHKPGEWTTLPVVRMHMAGKGLDTTHYGNNVRLVPGKYEVRVTVGIGKPALFHVTLSS